LRKAARPRPRPASRPAAGHERAPADAAGELPLASPELRWIYDTAPIGLAFLSPDCRYLQINQRLTDICGISVDDHLGRTVREMVPKLADQVEALVKSIVANGKPVTGIEVNGQRADGVGADRCWLTNWYPLKAPDGRVLGVNVAAEEITERKRAQAAVVASEERYRALVRATSSLVWSATADGQGIDTSEWCAFTGQSPEEVRGSGWFDAIHPYDRDTARDVWKKAIEKRVPFEVEYRIRRHDGVYVWHQDRGNAVLEADGSVREWVGICVDIDERKAAAEQREALNRSVEQALELLVSVSAGASAALTTQAMVEKSLERICSAQRWQFGQVWYPDASSGRLTCANASAWNAWDFAAFRQLSNDAALAPGEDLPGRVWETKSATWFEDLSFVDMGLTAMGFAPFPRLRPALDAGLKTALVFPVILGDEVLAVFECFSREQRKPDRTVLGAVDQLGRILGDFWVRKRSEAALRASEQRWRSVFEMSSLGISLVDHNMRIVATNQALQDMLGYTADEMLKLDPADLLHEEDRPAGRGRFTSLLSGERNTYESVTRFRHKSGAPVWVNSFVSTIPGSGESPPLYFSTAIDITARQKAESELRRAATYLAEAEKISRTGCWSRKIATSEVFWSPEECKIFGLDPATTPPTHQLFLSLIHPEDRATWEEAAARAVREKTPYDASYRAVLRDGTIKHIHTVGHPVLDDAGEVIELIGVSTDETERVRAQAAMEMAQAELEHVARLTTMGELAASIAHEVNQPLAAVVANGNAALRWLDRPMPELSEAKEALDGVVEEGKRASEVIGRIRAFLKNRKHDYVATDINEAIREVLALTKHALRGRNVTVQTSLPSEIPKVLGDRVQLQQVIMNLVINGADAMNAVSGRRRILWIGSRPNGGDHVVITVGDCGTGIDESIRSRVFDPLFTTKSNGMGMGLPICRGIVQAHGGKLWAAPASPHGTEFHFTVPIAAVNSPPVAPD
jgi:PAS domain S-box-containing protein